MGRCDRGGEDEDATNKERGRTKEKEEKDKKNISILQIYILVNRNFDNNIIFPSTTHDKN